MHVCSQYLVKIEGNQQPLTINFLLNEWKSNLFFFEQKNSGTTDLVNKGEAWETITHFYGNIHLHIPFIHIFFLLLKIPSLFFWLFFIPNKWKPLHSTVRHTISGFVLRRRLCNQIKKTRRLLSRAQNPSKNGLQY